MAQLPLLCPRVPQIFINDQHLGDCDELHSLERAGKLDALLSGSL
jgi:glutaredoxin 3